MGVAVLTAVFLLLTGLLAGTLFTVEVAVVPTLGALPGERWVQVHTLLDHRFDPMMPRINMVTLASCLGLVIFADGGEAIAVKADVTDHHQVTGLTAEVADRLGPVDILIANAAGLYGHDVPLVPFSELTWELSLIHI